MLPKLAAIGLAIQYLHVVCGPLKQAHAREPLSRNCARSPTFLPVELCQMMPMLATFRLQGRDSGRPDALS